MASLLLEYVIRVAAVKAVFCTLFNIFLREDKFHSFNRIALLSSCLLSFALPLVVFCCSYSVSSGEIRLIGMNLFFSGAISAERDSALLCDILSVYLTGVVLSVLYRTFSVCQLLLSIRKSRFTRIITVPGKKARLFYSEIEDSFSWFNFIVIGKNDALKKESLQEYIVNHELGHISMRHSADIILMDIAVALQWFNPFIYLMKIYLKDIHEYQADEYAVSCGADLKEYCRLILLSVTGSIFKRNAGSFFLGSAKDRIVMLTTSHPSFLGYLVKTLYYPLAIGLSLLVFSDINITF